jgi:oligopeptide/dipeptide ABC transporter ATP-binding protein
MSGMISDSLEIRNLKAYYFTWEGIVRAIDGIDLQIAREETLGVAGESGCGKSTLSNAILRIVPDPGKIVGGEIFFDGKNLLKMTENEMQKIRGKRISMIFQEPTSAMNPVIKIGDQIAEVIILHQGLNKKDAWEEALRMLMLTGIDQPETVANSYTFRLGPGIVQQAMIAMALSCRPQLLLADEPTSTMDMDTEEHIIELLKDLRQKLHLSMLYITHNLGVIAQLCDRVAIMYAGKIVEIGGLREVFRNPKHPYTEGLLKAFPRYDLERVDRLPSIPGVVPPLIDPPSGCRFHPRCEHAANICKVKEPHLIKAEENHFVACFFAEEYI